MISLIKKFKEQGILLLVFILVISLFPTSMVYAIDALPDLYNSNYNPTPITILTKNQADSDTNVKVAMVRQQNGKITFMVKDNAGVMQPFYPKAIETGFWDTRKQGQITDWDTVFQNYKDMGANTVQLMIHWADWEPQNGVFNYSYLDNIVNKASAKGLKIYFVIFFHYQWNMDTKYDNFWAYHLEDVNGSNKSIMWGTGNLNNIASIRSNSLEVFPEYWHPTLYPKLIEAITNLAEHYKYSSDVIAYQLGNEEGFNYYLNNGNDINPYYSQLFEKWKNETGGTDEGRFRLTTIQNLWKRMSSAVHQVDPYKPTTTNFQGSLPEKNGGALDWNEGVNCSFYKDANLDMVGPMFYGNDCYKIWNNLDPLYNYTKSVPVLFPTEIGAAGKKSINMKTYLMNTLERGAAGFGIYCYGEMLGTIHDTNLRKLLTMINASEDIIYNGLPVSSSTASSNIFISTTNPSAKLSNIEKDSNASLGLLYFPSIVRYGTAESISEIPVTIKVKNSGTYSIQVYTDGVLTSASSKQITSNSSYNFTVNMSNYSNTFIKVTLSNGSTPNPTEDANLALNKTVSSDSSETTNPPESGNDGNMSSRWCAADGSVGHWWKVDLGQSYDISSTEINWEQYNAYKYKIELSNDNINWTTVVDKTTNKAAAQVMGDSINANCRYLRITITGGVSSSVWASFYEMKVFKAN